MNKQELLNEIQEAKALLGEVEKKLKNYEENTYERWMPTLFKEYFTVGSCGIGCCIWNNDSADIFRWEHYNCFRTKEEAEQEAEKMLIRRQLEDIAKRLNKGNELIWSDTTQQHKYYLYFSAMNNSLLTDNVYFSKQQGTVYCLDPAFKDVAIKEIGKERLIKYLKEEKENDR